MLGTSCARSGRLVSRTCHVAAFPQSQSGGKTKPHLICSVGAWASLADGPEFAWSLQCKDCLYRVKLVLKDTVCPHTASLWPQGYCICGNLLSGAYVGNKTGLALNVYGQLH